MPNSLWIRCGALEQDKTSVLGEGGGWNVNQVYGHSDVPATPIQEQFKFHKLDQCNYYEDMGSSCNWKSICAARNVPRIHLQFVRDQAAWKHRHDIRSSHVRFATQTAGE